jgi:hypothetical protein
MDQTARTRNGETCNDFADTRLVTLYHRLHDTVHARSGQSAPLKLVYIRTEHEACVAWVSRSTKYTHLDHQTV